jgi:hypothetical protein
MLVLIPVYSTITVSNIPNPFACGIIANFSYTFGNSGLVNFTSTSSNISTNATYGWSFGDGATTNYSTSNANVTHTFVNNGTYNVAMILRDFNSFGNLCLDTVFYSVVVSNLPPKDTAVALKWNAYPVYSNTTTAVQWLFGDGASSTLFFPTHNYANAGLYNVCLIVTDICGAMDTLCLNTIIFKMVNNDAAMISLDVEAPVVSSLIQNNEVNTLLSIFPNPNNGAITINTQSETQFSIINELGQIINTDATNTANNFSAKVSGLNNGVYFINGISGDKVFSRRIVVTK